MGSAIIIQNILPYACVGRPYSAGNMEATIVFPFAPPEKSVRLVGVGI
jgi:hypothetical protein